MSVIVLPVALYLLEGSLGSLQRLHIHGRVGPRQAVCTLGLCTCGFFALRECALLLLGNPEGIGNMGVLQTRAVLLFLTASHVTWRALQVRVTLVIQSTTSPSLALCKRKYSWAWSGDSWFYLMELCCLCPQACCRSNPA